MVWIDEYSKEMNISIYRIFFTQSFKNQIRRWLINILVPQQKLVKYRKY